MPRPPTALPKRLRSLDLRQLNNHLAATAPFANGWLPIRGCFIFKSPTYRLHWNSPSLYSTFGR
jgi:hypothetical protein